MKKQNIKRLKYPIWFHIVFYVLIVLIPMIAVLYEGFNSPSATFRFTFGVFCGLIIAWIFIRKFALNGLEKNLRDKKAGFEHDYSIEVGNPDAISYLWHRNELWLTILNLIQVVLIGGLLLLIVYGISSACMRFTGTIYIVAISVLLGFAFKLIYILCQKPKSEVKEDETKTN